MHTKDKIKAQGLELFNRQGVQNITLRHIAQSLGISYGNVTYHYHGKGSLLEALYEDMNQQLIKLQSLYQVNDNLLVYFLQLPEYNFDITLDYIFFYKDFVELKRNYPDFFRKVEIANHYRKEKWTTLLRLLQQQGFLKDDLVQEDLEYIIDLSVGIRMFYFQNTELNQFDKRIFTEKVNRLLVPYLSESGKQTYTEAAHQSQL